MCIVCIEYEKGKLKINEALQNLEEIKESVAKEHYEETKELFTEKALNEDRDPYYLDRDVDEYWEKVGFGD